MTETLPRFDRQRVMQLSLEPGRIDLWFALCTEIEDPALLRAYDGLLSDAERERQRRFHRANDRRRHLVTRALVRTVLSRYAAVRPEQWTFVTNRYGRPEVANDGDDARRISFNVSHAEELVVLAVTAGAAIGVDTEGVHQRVEALELARHSFAPEEAAALCRSSPRRRQEVFFEYWTLKESYIKARGQGLSIPLDCFRFDLDPEGSVSIVIREDQNDSPSRWSFWQFRPFNGYVVAVCAERASREPPVVTLRKAIPLLSEEAFVCEPLRCSKWRSSQRR